ncbi:MAG: hypothetical protein AAFW87_06285 [Pseudomonadota bacterium]
MARKKTSKADESPDDNVTPEGASASEAEDAQAEMVDADGSAEHPEPEDAKLDSTKNGSDDEADQDPAADATGQDTEPARNSDAENVTDKDDEADADAQDDLQKDEARSAPEITVALPVATPEREQGPSVMPMVLGGIAAGAIGFAAAYFGLAQQPDARADALSKRLAEIGEAVGGQTGELATLTQKVDELGGAPDFAPVEAQLEGITEAIANLSERIATNETALEDLQARLTIVEQRPVTESASEAAIAAYERELQAAQDAMAEQRTELEALIESALSTENAAEDAAQAAMQRAATSRILTAIENGSAFSGALADLQATGAEVPAALTDVAETGVASISDLQNGFPEVARAALAASRAVSTDGGGLTGFLRNQLGARSLEPREGNDPDAVLSRAEASLRDGRLTDVLAEIEALPEEGRAEMSDWTGQVARRMEAVNAAQALSETLN